MSSSLAEQLQRLAGPQTSTLERGKKRASLLFDPKEAAGLKRETVYEIGLNGLEDLIAKNSIFEQFVNTLYSIPSKEFERSVETAENNKKLDKHIRKFLLLLSPYFSFTCTYKALEWLIYRYSIHEYNREDLLTLVLPYHELNIFVRVVQLLKIKDVGDPWFFLKSLQKVGVHLSKQSLLNHAANDPYFIKFTTNFILDLIKVHKNPSSLTIAFNFYCSVFTGAIEYSTEVSESIITQMLPSLMKGLNSDIPDFRASSYVIIVRLATKCTLSEIILDKFVQKIASHKFDNLTEEAVLVYIVLYQSQVSYRNIPEEALDNIIDQKWLPKIIQKLNNGGCCVYPFLEVLIKCLVTSGLKENGEKYRSFLMDLLNQLKIDDEYVATCMNAVIDSVPAKLKKRTGDAKTWLIQIIETLEKQYPTQFDQQIYKLLTSTSNEERKKKLQKIFKNTLSLSRKFEIFDKLHHPNSLVRSNAMKFISKNFDKLKEVEKVALESSLEDRLKDEDADVVKEALGIVETTKILKGDKLKEILLELLCKFYRDKHTWEKIIVKVIQMVCISEFKHDLNVILNVVPLLLPKTNDEIAVGKLVVKSELLSTCPLFENFNKNANLSNPGDFPNELFKSLKSTRDKDYFLNQLKKADYDTFSPLQKFITAIIVSNLIPKNSSLNQVLPYIEIFEKFVENSTSQSKKAKISILENLKCSKKGKLPVTGFLECICDIISKIGKIQLEYLDFSQSTDIIKFLLKATSILYRDHEIYSEYITQFNNILFENYTKKIAFILHLAVFKKIETCEILSVLMNEMKTIDDEFLSFNEHLVPYLLILMANNCEEIRRKSVEICEKILQNASRKDNSYHYVIEIIVEHREEIIMDSSQIAVILSKALVNEKNGKTMNVLIELACNSKLPIYFNAGVLELIREINSIEILEKTSKFANSILQKNCNEYSEFESIIFSCNIKRFDASIGGKLVRESSAVKFLVSVLKNDVQCLSLNDERKAPSLLVLEHIEAQFIASLSKEIEFLILDSIVEISTISQCPNILLASNKIFKHIDLDVKQILPALISMKEIYAQKETIGKKNRKSLTLPTADVLDLIEWKKGVRVLELIQDKKKMSNVATMLPILFDILKKCLDFDEQAAVEYTKQLILSLILHCCEKLEGSKISENVFNMELVVQCIRASPNPQTHHHALLVLAHCASLIPTQVLHHIMAIFTFMGSSVLRHDDAYSFQLIAKIIDTIIPILISDGDVNTVISVLRVFVDALLDVPEHRRHALYMQLIEKIQPDEYLHVFLLLVFSSHVLHGNEAKTRTPKHKFEDKVALKRLDIAASLVRDLSPDIIFASFIKLIQYLRQLPVEFEDLEKGKFDVDPSNLTSKQFRHFKYTILIFLNGFLSSGEFALKISALPNDSLENLEHYYKDMIVNILSYIQSMNSIVSKHANTNQAQYWKAIQHQSLEILDGLNALLTPEMFLLVIKGLMTHNILNIRKRALDLLNTKLHNQSFVQECSQEQLHDLVNPLVAIVDKLNTAEIEDHVVIQTALLSLKLIIKHVGSENPEKFVQLLEFITDIIKSANSEGNVLASLILCLAELCVTLRARAIQCLPNFMPTLLKILKQQKHQDSPTLLCLSLLTVVLKVLESLSLFFSPYLKKMLSEISQLSGKWECSKDDAKLAPFFHKLTLIKQKFGENIAPRILIPAIEESYDDLVKNNHFDALGSLMGILSENLSHVTGSSLNSNLPELTKFFINALEFRNHQKCDMIQTNVIEKQIIDALSSLVLKLSETTFRPFFYKIYEWAVRCEGKNDRIITFYNVSSTLAKQLKSLFILFAGSFIKNAAKILDDCNEIKCENLYFEDNEKNVLLLEKVLETLMYVFKYTTSKFITKERFEILMQPIVDHLENDIDGIENAEIRNDQLLTPCIVQFAIATADDALWKQMNYQILLKMRNSNPKIRLMSLRCLTEVVKQLGEDFLPLLPETIPFLSELLEDEEEIVEKTCKKAIQEMEKVLGENLHKYF